MSYTLIVQKISEGVDELLRRAHLPEREMQRYAEITSEHRKREWLKSKAMVWEEFGKNIDYTPSGAPVIEGGNISISHSRGYVAIIYCPERPCGIDVEWSGRDAVRMVHKFASPEEVEIARAIYPPNPELLVWCAKETLYKYAGVDGAEFIRDLLIEDCTEQALICRAFEQVVEVKIDFVDDMILCFCYGEM